MKALVQRMPLAIAALCLAASAQAHPSFQVRQAAVGAHYRAVINVPHGCDDSATTRERVQIPEGVIGVKPMLKPGWSIEVKRGTYERSCKFYQGAVLNEGVREISWSGELADEYFDDFVFSAFLTDSFEPGTTLYFTVQQDWENGSLAWTNMPAAGQDAHALKSPAPGVRLLTVADKGSAQAQSFKVGALVIEAPWARATPNGAQVGGGYMKITNTGSEPDRLIGGTLPIAGKVEVHEMAMSGSVMKMRHLADGLEIKPGASVELKPGGNHLMFLGLKDGLKVGQSIKGTLVFQKAGTVEVEYRIAPIGAKSGGDGGGHADH